MPRHHRMRDVALPSGEFMNTALKYFKMYLLFIALPLCLFVIWKYLPIFRLAQTTRIEESKPDPRKTMFAVGQLDAELWRFCIANKRPPSGAEIQQVVLRSKADSLSEVSFENLAYVPTIDRCSGDVSFTYNAGQKAKVAFPLTKPWIPPTAK
jgi:hypothetical protein